MAVQSIGWGCNSIHNHFGADPASAQNSAHRGAADLKAAGDFGFADPSPTQFPNLGRMESGGDGPAQPLAVLSGVGQASPRSFPQNLPFEFGVLRFSAIRR
jgi:hypothetical protein